MVAIHHVLWSTLSSGNVLLQNSSRAHEKLVEAVLQTKAPWQQREKRTSKAHCRLSRKLSMSDHTIYPATIQHSNGIPRVPIRNRSTNGRCSNAILRLPKCTWSNTTSSNFDGQICWPNLQTRSGRKMFLVSLVILLPKDAIKKIVSANHSWLQTHRIFSFQPVKIR